ncbi:MAG: 3-deoxy-D-manno-octulosonic acid transferase [Ignavibacteria bacterium]|nr:3-deoxy-D-manno-octulosonic acid transferase [Ignavibacteria bacterium]
MWQRLYSFLLLPFFRIGITLLALVNGKVRRGLRGRRDLLPNLRASMALAEGARCAWVHVSSMGEFEQAKPIIEALKAAVPDLCVVVSFFSPSGYDNSRRYPHADVVTYLPVDTRRNARDFLAAVRPDIAVFIRYDIWPNHVWACEDAGIPLVLANATMRDNSARLSPLARAFHRRLFNAFDAILTISESDANAFRRFALTKPLIEPAGDTRFDRVAGRADAARGKKLIPDKLVAGRKVLVVGSSWSEDEEVLLPALFTIMKNDARVLAVLVPHEPTIEHLETLEYKLKGKAASIRFSFLAEYADEPVILIDSIGILLSLYASADVAFVGGGFKSNVHNTLEPAAYGIPVLYGPKIQNSREAEQLREAGGGFIVQNKREAYRLLRTLLSDEDRRRDAGERAGTFVRTRAGATQRIVAAILPYFAER